MAVTDLTGYTWVGNDSLNLVSGINEYSINFICNNVNYDRFVIRYIPFPQEHFELVYSPIVVYSYNMQTGTWSDTAYKTIFITDGTDTTNVALIEWLEANGTLTPPVVASGKMYFGTSSISKMYFGQQEVSKVYFGQDLVYEKQAPSGFTVSGRNDASSNKAFYSTDNGTTWIAIPTGDFTLPAMETFKLKIGGFADYLMSATSVQLGINLPLTESAPQISDNYTLTETITDLTIHGEWD